jgi:hypothetical protein
MVVVWPHLRKEAIVAELEEMDRDLKACNEATKKRSKKRKKKKEK